MATAVPSPTLASKQDTLSSPSSHAGPAAQPITEVPGQEPKPALEPSPGEKKETEEPEEGEADVGNITSGLGGMILQAPLVALEKVSPAVANRVAVAGQSVSNALHSYTRPAPVETTTGESTEVPTSASTVQPQAGNIDVAVSSMEQPGIRKQVVADEAVVQPQKPLTESVGEKVRAAGQTAGQYLPSQETQAQARRTSVASKALDTTMATLGTASAAIGSAAATTVAAAAEQASHAASVAQNYLPEKLGGTVNKSDETKALTLEADPSTQDKDAERKFDLTGNVHDEPALDTKVSTHEPTTGGHGIFESTADLDEQEPESSLTAEVPRDDQLKLEGAFARPVGIAAESSPPPAASSGLDLSGSGSGSPHTYSALATDSPVDKTDVTSLSEPATSLTSQTADAGDSVRSAPAVVAPLDDSTPATVTFADPTSSNTEDVPNEAQSTATTDAKSESTAASDAKEGEPKPGLKAKLTDKIKHIGHH
ncbi:hypothetical protein JCM1840_007354 [Sporobolomyces johnsonii]